MEYLWSIMNPIDLLIMFQNVFSRQTDYCLALYSNLIHRIALAPQWQRWLSPDLSKTYWILYKVVLQEVGNSDRSTVGIGYRKHFKPKIKGDAYSLVCPITGKVLISCIKTPMKERKRLLAMESIDEGKRSYPAAMWIQMFIDSKTTE